MSISIGKLIQIMGKPKLEDNKSTSFKDLMKKCSTLKDLQEKKCHSLTQTYWKCLMILLKKGSSNFQKKKWAEEVGRTANLKYCRYHRIVSHPLEKCITLTKCIVQLCQGLGGQY